ncbi:hypothetical protein [Metapseudomonas otitidis]|uniref:hypothetical protein n=1 Tax=Metapseudomonas otitidis TaxID=319939 RepID=UPI0013F6823B|nr:hypothetical protein [Pseudomonas otitidis]
MKYLIEISKEVGKELRLGAALMLVLLPVGLVIAVPVVLLAIYLPDWAWITLMVIGFTWLMLGDAVVKGIRKARTPTPPQENDR